MCSATPSAATAIRRAFDVLRAARGHTGADERVYRDVGLLRVRGLVVDLIAATRTELDRAMRACGWMPCRWADSEVYERPVPGPFVLRAQFWINGAPVALECTVWIACEAADEALGELGEDDVETWVSRD